MSNYDQKFWIGITSAFIIPTLAYVYTQGMTAQSIRQLSASVDKYQTTVDNLNDQILIIANNANNNTAEIASVNKLSRLHSDRTLLLHSLLCLQQSQL